MIPFSLSHMKYRVVTIPYIGQQFNFLEEAKASIEERKKHGTLLEVWCDNTNYWSIADKDGNCVFCKRGGY